MRIIIPMAGMGKRLRPHTLVTPKPLVKLAEKSIVQRLVEDIVAMQSDKIEEIAFVVGKFGDEVERELIDLASSLGAKGSIHYQDKPLGTAHAVLCAASALNGPVTVAFADTLFRANFQVDSSVDGILWVKKIEDPQQFGVVKLNESGEIVEFVEKPKEFVSDLAMIGIYYFKSGEALKTELEYLIENNIQNGGEFQLPDAMRNMMRKGAKFIPGEVQEWMDCGNKDAVLDTLVKLLPAIQNTATESLNHVEIIEPCYLGKNVVISNSKIGPNVSIASGTVVENVVISNSSVGVNCVIKNSNLKNSFLDDHNHVDSFEGELDLGSYNRLINK
jgi:glucose-1-phosphate thymidylyltransferase